MLDLFNADDADAVGAIGGLDLDFVADAVTEHRLAES